MLVQLGIGRYSGQATLADSPCRQGSAHPTEAHWGALTTTSPWMPHYGRTCFNRATWGAASRPAGALSPIVQRLWGGICEGPQ
eukprot:4796356-Alexandrium_andersonii.AAC.2